MQINTLDKAKQNEKTVMRISTNSMIVNIVLSVFKIAAGLIAKSGAMVSDGIHSASDVFSTIVVMVGYKMSGKESDAQHQYGHERIECVAAIILSMILCLTGIMIGLSGVQKILNMSAISIEAPGVLALIAAVVSIAVKEGMYWYTYLPAKRINSSALMADAWHHRSDALSSIGSLVGIAGARLGFPVCDPIASVVICVFIVKAAYDIFMDAISKMMDTSCSTQTLEEMKAIILAQEGVRRIDGVRTRLFGSRIYVDVEIAVNGELSVSDAHAIAELVHDAIEGNFEDVKHCMVHVNPCKK